MMVSATSLDSDGGYVVELPRVTDAIGGALRRGYTHASPLPDEMRRLLDRLDRQPPVR